MHSFSMRVSLKLQVIISKLSIVFLCLAASFLLGLVFVSYYQSSNFKSIPQPTTKHIGSLAYPCCTPLNNSIRTNVYFIKTHKTASSTVQSIILRFAGKNGLSVMNVKYYSYFWPLSDASIFPNSLTPNGKYHVLAQHIRYHPDLRSYQYPDTSMVTILRNPVKVFHSLYNYFKMDEKMGMTFRQFLNMPVKPPSLLAIDSAIAYRGYNQMSVDLGFDIAQSENSTAISEFLETIDRDFDLVMIAEYLDASLVLLANLMGWPLEYVAHLNLNSKPPGSDSGTLAEEHKDTIVKLNPVDSLLYSHFLKKFRKCVQQYGEDELNNQIQRLQILNERLEERCVAGQVVRGLYDGDVDVMQYVLKNPLDLECVYSAFTDYGVNSAPEMWHEKLFD